ncbi:Sua5/YciO/YrdC/YwlC family protein [Nocardioides sp.]|uniref:Sua5/YciO/YrdC/YwlC family protein n=1 Tax=Nocardioides sp. TaxID=35761 RepID=UPI003D10F76B
MPDEHHTTISCPDLAADVQAMWEVLSHGGVVICPAAGGYTIAGPGTKEGGARINEIKGRPAHKRLGLMMGNRGEREVHILDDTKRAMITCITETYNLPIHVIARFRADHPLIQQLDADALKLCTANGTITSGVNMGGFFLNAVNARAEEGTLFPVFASSCNASGAGPKARVEDIEPEVLAAADLVIDYGPQDGYSSTTSTQFNFDTMQLVRWGRAFDSIAWVMKRHFGIDLPPDPGREVSPGGHVDEFALVDAD